MSGIKGKSGVYKRKLNLNKIVDCLGYYEIIIESQKGEKIYRVKIDKEDLNKIQTGKWSCSATNYPLRIINNKTTLLHNVIIGKKKDCFVDHINGDRLDNRKSNLRFVTVQQNAMNRAGMRGVYLSNYYKNKKHKKWVAHIIYKEKFHYLGIYDSEAKALEARKKGEIKYFGNFRRK